jgi:hypothetical protein
MSSIRAQMRKLLKRAPLYCRLRSSRIRDVYWRVAAKHGLAVGNKQLDFYRNFLMGSGLAN